MFDEAYTLRSFSSDPSEGGGSYTNHLTLQVGCLQRGQEQTRQTFGHDGDALGVDGTQVGVLEERDQVGFRGLLLPFEHFWEDRPEEPGLQWTGSAGRS